MAVSQTSISTPLLINGEERETTDSFAVHDPHDGSVIGHAAAASEQDALDAVAAAQAAWPAWSQIPAAERAQITLRALDGLDSDFGERAEVLSRENGKIRFEAEIDLHVFSGRFHLAALFAPELDSPEHIAGPPYRTTIEHVSAGVVTIIFPFNWPLAILAASLPYALMAGNTVIAKPPPTTPLSSVMTLRHVARGLPPGVLNVITGHDAVVGPIVVGDPRVKHICFTGSVPVAAPDHVDGGAQLDQCDARAGWERPRRRARGRGARRGDVGRIAGATFMTTGQVCMAIKRLYVPRSRYGEVVDGLRAVLQDSRVGCGLNPEVTMAR